jgi:uncharacterized delta-60 repeat protein
MRNTRSFTLLVLAVSLTAAPAADADGMLDPTFGSGGWVFTGFSQFSQDYAMSLVMLPDGRALAAGYTIPNLATSYMAAARYLPSGALDPTFDADGTAFVTFPNPPPGFGSGASAQAALLQPDGRVVLVGTVGYDFPPEERFALARLNSDGSLDSDFGIAGRVTTPFPNWGVGAAGVLQPDGRIVVVGNADPLHTPTLAAARYNANGKLDPAFGTNGQVVLPFPFPFRVRDVALQPDGKLVIAGRYGPLSPADGDFGLARLMPDGAADPSFGSGGLVTTDFGGSQHGYSVMVLPDGRLVLAGTRAAPEAKWFATDVALVRYLPDGSLDTTFGTGGLATAPLATVDAVDEVIRLPNGNLLVAGSAAGQGTYDFLLARFLPDGVLDPTFGTDGFLRTSFSPKSSEQIHAVAIAGPDRILAAGMSQRPPFPNYAQFALARYVILTTQ